MTWSNVSFETVWWISVAKFMKNSSTAYLDWSPISTISWTTPYTFGFWFRMNTIFNQSWTWRSWKNKYWDYDKFFSVKSDWSIDFFNFSTDRHWYLSNAWLVSVWQWYCYIQSYDWTTLKWFLNNVLIWSVSPAPSYSYSNDWWWRFILWKLYNISSDQWLDWYTSKLFIEDKWRTSSDVDNFFKRTKKEYGY